MLASIGVDASEHGSGGHIGYHIFSEAFLPAAPWTFRWLRGPFGSLFDCQWSWCL